MHRLQFRRKCKPICSLLRHPFLWPHFPSGHSESEAEMNFPWFIPFWFPYTGSILLFSKPSTAFILLLYFFFNWTCWTSLRSGCKWHVFCGFSDQIQAEIVAALWAQSTLCIWWSSSTSPYQTCNTLSTPSESTRTFAHCLLRAPN